MTSIKTISELEYVKLEDKPPLNERLSLLNKLIQERVKICFQSKRPEDVALTFRVTWDFIKFNFDFNEKRNFVIGVIVFVICSLIFIELISHNQIDEAIENHQSARAEKLIKQRLFFMRGNNGLQLRLAHAYLALGRESEAKSIVESIQNQNPAHSYIPKVALDLSETLKRRGKAYEAINILEKIPVNSCKECLEELLALYSIEGRRSLIEKNLERANFLLTRALKLSIKLKESNSSINHRKRELSRVYNLQASQLIAEDNKDKAIVLYEKSVDIFPKGQTYMKLGDLYLKEQEGKLALEKALESYMNAYSFGVTDVEANFNKALAELKALMKKDGLDDETIKKQTKKYELSQEATSIKIKEPKIFSKKQKSVFFTKKKSDKKVDLQPKIQIDPKEKAEEAVDDFEPEFTKVKEASPAEDTQPITPANKKKRLFQRSPYQEAPEKTQTNTEQFTQTNVPSYEDEVLDEQYEYENY